MFHRNSIACFTQTSRKIMFLLRPSLRPQLHALGWLAGLLLSKLFSAAVASPWMCCKGFLGVTPCLHNSLGLAKSFAALKTTPLQTNPVLHKCPAPRPHLHALAGSAALLHCYSLHPRMDAKEICKMPSASPKFRLCAHSRHPGTSDLPSEPR